MVLPEREDHGAFQGERGVFPEDRRDSRRALRYGLQHIPKGMDRDPEVDSLRQDGRGRVHGSLRTCQGRAFLGIPTGHIRIRFHEKPLKFLIMRKSDRPPNYLIDKIVRHTNIIITASYGSVRYMDAVRLLKKEVKKLETYKRYDNERS